MTNIAILGFGVVGSGIARVIEVNEAQIKRLTSDDVYVKYILDKREFPESPYKDRIVKDISLIVSDPEISIVCEAMGGVHPAYEFTMAAFMAGKSVITSNKELVANCGVELQHAARKHGVTYLFEASVGGGIPEIRSMRTSLAMDNMKKIDGIMNGTTNYILTRMKNGGVSFEEALKEAQSLGYAEANPSADVDGIDAQRKIMILSAIATNKLADEKQVYAETMTKISSADVDAASRSGHAVKLIGSFRKTENGMTLYVCPRFVPLSNPLAHIEDVFNGIKVTCEMTGEVMYYGRGAGSYPTAAAMVSDITAIMTGCAKGELIMRWRHTDESYVMPFEENLFSYYVRIKTDSLSDTDEKVNLVLGGAEKLEGAPAGYAEYITDAICEKDMKTLISEGTLGEVESLIRVLD